MGHEEIREAMEHVIGVEPSFHQDGKALPTEIIDDHQDLDGTTVVRAVSHEIIGTDVVAMGGPEPVTDLFHAPSLRQNDLRLAKLPDDLFQHRP